MSTDLKALADKIKDWGQELGFQQIGIADIELSDYHPKFYSWLAKGFHGEMSYMQRHASKRCNPRELIPNTLRVITARMNYLPANTACIDVLRSKHKAYISRYALGRDYHKIIRKRLQVLANKINHEIMGSGFRAFCDSAPVLEKPLAEKSGLGWIGKHTNLINAKAGSWFFLGEIFTDLALPIDLPQTKSHCGSCRACIDVCPSNAIIAPYQLDARRCISYLTIEHRSAIPTELRPLIGNRIYGCDDCQLVCPWNKFARVTTEPDFQPRHNLQDSDLLQLFSWGEQDFMFKTMGSAIRRIGYEMWLRNIAVALGNAHFQTEIVTALQQKLQSSTTLVKEHITWALQQQLRHRRMDE